MNPTPNVFSFVEEQELARNVFWALAPAKTRRQLGSSAPRPNISPGSKLYSGSSILER